MDDEHGAVFYLVPQPGDDLAAEIVEDGVNRDRPCEDPNDVSKSYLRIGLNQPVKVPGRLVTFGRMPFMNDVMLRNERFSKTDQCYFDFHPTTGELLLHDISKDDDTQIYNINEENAEQIWRSPRQCVVRLNREYIFEIGDARFRLVPRRAPSKEDEAAFAAERLDFVRRIPDEFKTLHGTLERLQALGMQSSPSTNTARSYNLRRKHPDQRKPGDEIRHARVRELGSGGQGAIDEVVDLHTGDHFARKVCRFKVIPEWRIYEESGFKGRIKKEVDLVKKAPHEHIVPYLDHQGWQIGRLLEIFMPVYQGNLQTLLEQCRPQGEEAVRAMTDRMFYQMLLALDHVHARAIIHRDIKPENILYQGNKFLLTDFGIAKVVDTSRTMAGTEWYMAPEIWLKGEQTAKVDIYALGATYIECMEELPPQAERRTKYHQWQQWHQYLQTLASQHASHITPMLGSLAAERPTARALLDQSSRQWHQASLQNSQNNLSSPRFGALSSLPNQANGTPRTHSTAPTPMDWTRTGAIAFYQGHSPPTQQDESRQALRPNLVAVQSSRVQPSQPNLVAIQPENVIPDRPAQLGSRRGESVKSAKSTDGRQKKRHKRSGSSQNGRHGPSQSAGVPKRTPSRNRRLRSNGMHKAQEKQALRIA